MPHYTIVCDGCPAKLTATGKTYRAALQALRRRAAAKSWMAPSLFADIGKLPWVSTPLRIDTDAFLREQQTAHGQAADRCPECVRKSAVS